MAHNFNFPAPSYQRNLTQELYSPLTEFDMPSDTNFAQVPLVDNSVGSWLLFPPVGFYLHYFYL